MHENEKYQERRHEIALAKAKQDPLRKSLAEFIDVIKLILLALSVLAAFALFGYAQQLKDDTCDAPCTVHFSKPMAEDNFKIDYRGDGTLRVWKAQADG